MDQKNDGAEIHLGKIADAMVEWKTRLAPALGLTAAEVRDIVETHRHEPGSARSVATHVGSQLSCVWPIVDISIDL